MLSCRGKVSWTLAALTSLCVSAASADVKLPGFYGEHMVLQRDVELPIWGWAAAGEKVTVELGPNKAEATADESGKWKVKLPPLAAGGPHTLKVKGNNEITLGDILIGEVWLCSGQSNMEWVVWSSSNKDQEIAAGNHPQIRHFKIAHRPSATPIDDVSSTWQICSPETVGGFTACGYFMARELQKELGVPVGLINSSWGGTRIEPWTPPSGFAEVPALKSVYEKVNLRSPDNPAYQEALRKHIEAVEAWTANAKYALAEQKPVTPSPGFPDSIKAPTSHQEPVMLYNGMIHALVGFPIRGAIWYQGESNHDEGMMYFEKKKALVNGWRKLWGIGEFPFYFVQIAPWQYGQENPAILANFWEAQSACLQIPNTGMVVTNDIATLNDIHPPNKQDVGKRLALLALKRTYGKADVVDSGPTFQSLSPEGDKLRVKFENAAGLKSRDGKPLTHFEVIGKTGGFKPANATIDGESVLLSAQGVAEPVAMRFAWNKLAEPNLVNGAGLPTSAFRAGEVPKPDYLSEVPEAKEYTLVYDLDIEKARRPVEYDADNSESITQPFDRIAYMLELQTAGGDAQYAFVSMNAFTKEIKKVGVPDSDQTKFQTKVAGLNVASNVKGITTGTNLEGNIEFWPNNYAQQNTANIPGASNQIFDFGDTPGDPVFGYGCMQVHNFKAKQTIFSLNHWANGSGADLGIGNSTGDNRDWTFSGNAGTYPYKRLRVFVRVKN